MSTHASLEKKKKRKKEKKKKNAARFKFPDDCCF